MSYPPNPQHPCPPCSVLLCILTVVALSAPLATAAPIDEFRLSDIEQKIRDLETVTREQARQLSQLQSQNPGSRSGPAPLPGNATAKSSDELRWVNAASWNRIKPGMSELQVVELLGAPTQMRIADDNQSRQLLYALEIGRSGYLSGRVTFSKGLVTVVEIPTLK